MTGEDLAKGKGQSTLVSILSECQECAARGYEIASNHEKSLSNTWHILENKVQGAINEIGLSLLRPSGATRHLQDQLIDIQKAFDDISFAFQEDLNNLYTGDSCSDILIVWDFKQRDTTIKAV